MQSCKPLVIITVLRKDSGFGDSQPCRCTCSCFLFHASSTSFPTQEQSFGQFFLFFHYLHPIYLFLIVTAPSLSQALSNLILFFHEGLLNEILAFTMFLPCSRTSNDCLSPTERSQSFWAGRYVPPSVHTINAEAQAFTPPRHLNTPCSLQKDWSLARGCLHPPRYTLPDLNYSQQCSKVLTIICLRNKTFPVLLGQINLLGN